MHLGTGWLLIVVVLLIFMVYLGTIAGRGKMRKHHHQQLPPPSSQPPAEPFKRRSLRWRTLEGGDNDLLGFFLADRSIGPVAGTASLTATWTGGSYLSEIAYVAYHQGYLWAHKPFGYALALIIGGRFFAARIRQNEYITMLDVFHDHVGKYAPAVFIWPALFCEVIWSASVLRFAGVAFNDMTNVAVYLAMLFVVVTALTYSTLGGYYTVVHNNMVQIIICSLILWICVPFCMSRHEVGTLSGPDVSLLGAISTEEAISVIDIVGATALGGVVRQEFFQSVLSSDRVVTAKMSSYASGIACLLVALPPLVVGGAARITNFTVITAEDPARMVGAEAHYRLLPYALMNLSPFLLAPVILTVLASSVLSSLSSSCMATGSMVTHNVYHALLRPTAQDREVSLVMRVSMIVSGVASMTVAMFVKPTGELLLLSTDVAYVTLFPQLVSAFYLPTRSNPYGCLAGFAVAVALRALCGIPAIGVPARLPLPLYDDARSEQRFPFRILCMLFSLGAIVATSAVFSALINAGVMRDVLGCEPVASPVEVQRSRKPSAAMTLHGVSTPPQAPTPVSWPSSIDSGNKQAPTPVDTDVPTHQNTNMSGNETPSRAKEPPAAQAGHKAGRKASSPKPTTSKRVSTVPSPEHIAADSKLRKKRRKVSASRSSEAVTDIASRRTSKI